MPLSQPPYDRTIVLPCRMSIFRERWLHVVCGCGQTTTYPIQLMVTNDSGLGARTLAEAVIRLQCAQCSERPRAVYLAEDARGPHVSGAPAGWSILLHGDSHRVI